MNKSYGGYLPIELRKGADYFSSMPAKRFNCANAAIDYILDRIDVQTIYVPLYMCPNICENLNSKDIQVVYYHIGEDLLPRDDFAIKDACVYITDYFGIMGKKTDDLINVLSNKFVIADFCHAFYHKPILRDNVYNIYSARKFFGVPDGAYLINNSITSDYDEESHNYSSDYSSYLLKSLEHGTNYSYKEKKDADLIIKQNKAEMSLLSRRIMDSIDYEDIKRIRANNAGLYDEAFKSINTLQMEAGSSPYMYPLNIGSDIRNFLIQEKVFTPTLWGQLLSDSYTETIESKLTANTVFLPVDQRYNSTDINKVINITQKYI